MAQMLQIDSQWVVEKLTSIGEAVAVLPEMKDHLKRLNDTVADHETRIVEIERAEEGRRRNWKTVLGVALRVIEGVLLAAVLLRFGLG